MNKVLRLPAPFDRQKEFLRAKARFVAYGGSRGGGKSFAVRLKAALLALNHGGIRILIMRRSYPELYENHIKLMRQMLDGVASYRDTDKSLTFPNSSLIKFGYCDCDSDAVRYQGQEYDVIFIDEATHFTFYQFNCLRAAVRGANRHPKRMYLTCNPGGIGHAWVKRLFIDRDFTPDENPDDYVFIRATVYDNKPLLEHDRAYLETLRALPEDMRRAWLEGDWDLEAGQFFSEFRRSIHVVEPFPIPPEWRIVRAFDYGLDMLACIWAAIDTSGKVYVIRELYEPGLIVSEAAKRIREATRENIRETLAPPDLWNRQKDSGRSMAELFEEAGIKLRRADANRVQGWMQVKEYLAIFPARDGGEPDSRLKIFSNCKNLIRTLPALMHDPSDPCDVSGEPHELTHLPDALRYLLRSHPAPSVVKTRMSETQLYRAEAIRRCAGKNRKGNFN